MSDHAVVIKRILLLAAAAMLSPACRATSSSIGDDCVEGVLFATRLVDSDLQNLLIGKRIRPASDISPSVDVELFRVDGSYTLQSDIYVSNGTYRFRADSVVIRVGSTLLSYRFYRGITGKVFKVRDSGTCPINAVHVIVNDVGDEL